MGWGRKGCSDGTVIPESQDNHLNDATKKVTCGQQRLLESEKWEVISDSEGQKWLSGGRWWWWGKHFVPEVIYDSYHLLGTCTILHASHSSLPVREVFTLIFPSKVQRG